jgi:excisionase family DNA binding protein
MCSQAIRIREPLATQRRLPKSLLANPDDRMLKLQEAADLTGVHVARIRRAIADGELRAAEFGPCSRRVLLSELRKWWESKTPEEIAPRANVSRTGPIRPQW